MARSSGSMPIVLPSRFSSKPSRQPSVTPISPDRDATKPVPLAERATANPRPDSPFRRPLVEAIHRSHSCCAPPRRRSCWSWVRAIRCSRRGWHRGSGRCCLRSAESAPPPHHPKSRRRCKAGCRTNGHRRHRRCGGRACPSRRRRSGSRPCSRRLQDDRHVLGEDRLPAARAGGEDDDAGLRNGFRLGQEMGGAPVRHLPVFRPAFGERERRAGGDGEDHRQHQVKQQVTEKAPYHGRQWWPASGAGS